MATAKLTVRLPKEDIEFAKQYARAHGLTLTELIDRHFRHLRNQMDSEIHPEVEQISGLVPAHVNTEGAEYHEHLLKKHQ